MFIYTVAAFALIIAWIVISWVCFIILLSAENEILRLVAGYGIIASIVESFFFQRDSLHEPSCWELLRDFLYKMVNGIYLFDDLFFRLFGGGLLFALVLYIGILLFFWLNDLN